MRTLAQGYVANIIEYSATWMDGEEVYFAASLIIADSFILIQYMLLWTQKLKIKNQQTSKLVVHKMTLNIEE